MLRIQNKEDMISSSRLWAVKLPPQSVKSALIQVLARKKGDIQQEASNLTEAGQRKLHRGCAR